MVGGHRRELGTGRQQRGQVKNQVDLELRENALEQVLVENRAGELAVHQPRDVRVERVHVEGHNCLVALLGEVGDQGMANFAISAGYQNNLFAHRYSSRRPEIGRLRYYM